MQMAEQPTADSKPAIDSFHLLHAKISEVVMKGKKINHFLKVYTPLLKTFSSLHGLSTLDFFRPLIYAQNYNIIIELHLAELTHGKGASSGCG